MSEQPDLPTAPKVKILTYLACPYTHPDPAVREARFHAANLATSQLSMAGEKVFSPISQSHPVALAGGLPTDWEYWADFDTAILEICCRIVVLALPGWQESKGVQAEIAIAERLGIPMELLRPQP